MASIISPGLLPGGAFGVPPTRSEGSGGISEVVVVGGMVDEVEDGALDGEAAGTPGGGAGVGAGDGAPGGAEDGAPGGAGCGVPGGSLGRGFPLGVTTVNGPFRVNELVSIMRMLVFQ